MRTTILAFACAIAYASWCGAQTPKANAAGVISGTVKGNDGSTITAGLVTASGIPDSFKSRPARTSASAAIQPDGAFALPALSTGRYRICVEGPNGTWLNPCEWGSDRIAVTLTPSRPSASVSIVLNKGALVSVRVNDSAQLLSANEGKTPGAHLLLGVGTDALFFRNASIVSQDAGGRNYQLLIPFGKTIGVSVASALFQLADATGKALPKSNTVPILVPSGQQAPRVVFTVTAVASY